MLLFKSFPSICYIILATNLANGLFVERLNQKTTMKTLDWPQILERFQKGPFWDCCRCTGGTYTVQQSEICQSCEHGRCIACPIWTE
ncbi:uncharacterized protein BDW43DRAFT_268701 [Aspergillus alliaceus]|uniref:uncharacterized protein n=1 Tax=Petromyces alliaceus TaxID=209559 RepID=UPI0012A4B04B|nr:uncharacterized protein BDW43DRAFT_268701 [Aspergillus alliaceus]KAB8235955.1 hypothetical protein BDW43DRAFT_268701 [Aspergillus alliaceus]